ncbi:hypothetical protein KUL49_26300 [Alteromonas sp. KUL49]|nr:hypothetical protein KUL49_26300 [Alteromonas sp. KUL49]
MYIHVKQAMKATTLQVRDELLNHEGLERFFNARFQVKSTTNQSEVVGGEGTKRTVKIGPISFDEVITVVNDDTICYAVVGDAPVKNHLGTIKLYNSGSYCEVDYTITCQSNTLLPGFILSWFIKRDVTSALFKLATYFDSHHQPSSEVRERHES